MNRRTLFAALAGLFAAPLALLAAPAVARAGSQRKNYVGETIEGDLRLTGQQDVRIEKCVITGRLVLEGCTRVTVRGNTAWGIDVDAGCRDIRLTANRTRVPSFGGIYIGPISDPAPRIYDNRIIPGI